MREIKFRVWDSRFKRMIAADEVMICAATGKARGCKGGPGFVDHWAPLQFTGLYDKNGKEVYEGDIVGEKDVWWEPVVFDQGCFCVDLDPIGYHFEGEDTCLEILGNIYENPELLK